MCGGIREALAIRRTPCLQGEQGVRGLALLFPCVSNPSFHGSPWLRPFRHRGCLTLRRNLLYVRSFRFWRSTNMKKQHTSRAVCPFSQTGFLSLCSLYVVICVFFEDFGYGKTSKSRRIASTDGGTLSGNTGKPLELGCCF